ncbi:hypothetical protein B5X24_HaOG216990 [Helicoverpa armigera]|uniref:Uncharacterized protein n=1 Tax=Helicoverpa armigera TaxID=29058 RepID=A0A2W1BVM8_HELAM|nr:hypothetical protein B5X24_HaOG216990 [Helicoverpa armigera]
MRKRGSLTDETIPTRYAPKTIRSAPVTPCDSETSTWSDRNRSKHSYEFPSGYATSYGDYEKSSYNSGYDYTKAGYEASTSTASASTSHNKGYESGVYDKSYDAYDKGYEGSYRYEGSTGYDKGEPGFKHSYESEGMWWWRRPLGVRRTSCRRCGANSATRPLRMTPCAGVACDAEPPRRPVMSRDRPLQFVKQLFL